MASLVWNLIINDRGAAGVNSFRNQLERARRASDENGFSLARSGEKAAKFGTAILGSTAKIGAFSVAAGHAAPAIAGVGAALVQVSGVAGLLPGVIGAAVVAQQTFKLATAGVGDALKLAAEGGKEYEAALKELAPNQRNFVKAVAGQSDQLKKLKQDLGQRMFKNLASDVKPLADKYFPVLHRTLGMVANSFSDTFNELTKWGKSSSTVSKFNTFLGNSAVVAGDFLKTLKPIAAGLLNIFTASSQKLPELTEGIGDAAKGFEAWTERITAGGRGGAFGQWVDTGIATLGKFKAVIVGVGKILGSIFSAAGKGAGGSGLDRLVETLGKVDDAVNTPTFQGGLKKIFDAIAQSSKAVSAALPGVLAAAAQLAPAFANVVAAGGTSFAATLKSIGQIITTVAPLVNHLSEALGPLAPIMGTLVPYLFLFSKAMALWSIIGPVVAAIRTWIVVQGGLNAVLLANPIGIVIAAIALLVAGFVLAYKKSALFRYVVQESFKVVSNVILSAIDAIISSFSSLFGVLGHLPGKAGKAFRSAENAANNARTKISMLKNELNAINGKKVYVSVITEYHTTGNSGSNGHATGAGSGRTTNAAGDNPITAGMVSLVGEQGPEIAMPTRDTSYLPANLTAALRGGSGGNTYVTVNVYGSVLSTKRELKRLILEALESGAVGTTPPSAPGKAVRAPNIGTPVARNIVTVRAPGAIAVRR